MIIFLFMMFLSVHHLRLDFAEATKYFLNIFFKKLSLREKAWKQCKSQRLLRKGDSFWHQGQERWTVGTKLHGSSFFMKLACTLFSSYIWIISSWYNLAGSLCGICGGSWQSCLICMKTNMKHGMKPKTVGQKHGSQHSLVVKLVKLVSGRPRFESLLMA